jgi:transposase InsO family protein
MKLKITAIAALLSITAVSCSSPKTNEKKAVTGPSKASQAVRPVADNKGAYYAVLKFDKGTQRLNDASKKDLKDFIASAQREGRTIDDIKILAWPDREYPAAGVRLTDRDVKIATQRFKSIEKYLKDDLNTIGNYETYNMAKRPNKVSDFVKGDDYKTKRIFERSGAAQTGSDMQAFVNSKASKALIMIDYKE